MSGSSPRLSTAASMRPAISCPGSATPATGSLARSNRLPGGIQQFADDRRALDLARVRVNPAVVHRVLRDQVELIRCDPDIAQFGRQAEAGDQVRDYVGCRLAWPTKSLADPHLFLAVHPLVETQHVGEHHATSIAVRHTRGAAEHVPDSVAPAFADPGLRADHRHPRADLEIEPGSRSSGSALTAGRP